MCPAPRRAQRAHAGARGEATGAPGAPPAARGVERRRRLCGMMTGMRGGPAVTCLALASVPGVAAQQLFGITVSTGVLTIFLVIVFLFVVPCVTKFIHIIRKFAALRRPRRAARCRGWSCGRLTAARCPQTCR